MALPVGQSLHLPRRGDGSIWTPDRYVAPVGLYDLSGIPARFNAVELPDQPVATNPVTVSNQTQLNAALVSGNQITVNAGSYTSLSLSGGLTDIEINLSNSAVFSGGLVMTGAQRAKVTGGVFNGGVYTLAIQDACYHITIDNVRFANGATFFPWNGNTPHHIALLNCTLNAPGSGYGLLSGAIPHQVYANCNITNGGSTVAGMRLASPSNVIIIDSRIFSSGNRIFRWNGDDAAADLLLLQNCQLESDDGAHNMWLTPSSGGGPNRLTRFEMHGCSYYNPGAGLGGGPFQIDGNVSPGIDDVIITNNTFYCPDGAVGGSGVTNYVSSPNTFLAYQAPPAFSGGADH